MVSRRRFLLVGLGVGSTAGVVALPAGATTAPAPTTATLWKLSADWGYPAGPKRKTRCKGRACHLHAANKIYATEADALAGRLHICCVAQAVSFEVPIEVHHELTNLPPTGGPALGDRRSEVVNDALERAALAAHEAARTAAAAHPPAQLASTGTNATMLAASGVALGAVGATALVIARRNGEQTEPS